MTRPQPTGPLGDALARLPLVPRPARTAPPLQQRVEELSDLAARAADGGDTALAAQVHRRAAVLAHDRGHPNTAYGLCNLDAHLRLQHRPLSTEDACEALRSQLTAADLLVRDGRPAAAVALLGEVSRAIGEDTDAATAAATLPLAGLAATAQDRGHLYEWWDSVSLLPTAHALVRDGRWTEARLLLKADPLAPPGPYERRQVEAVALALDGRPGLAATLLAKILLDPRSPWEHVVTEVLATACALIGEQSDLTARFDALGDALDTYTPTSNPEFDTRLLLTVADLCSAADRPPGAHYVYRLATGWALTASEGYSAHALLRHRLASELPEEHRRELTAITEGAGLRPAPVPADLDERITAALAQAATVITTALSAGPGLRQR
ncbi:hypothetical protein [Kitasatospora sp. NPDC088783]|uniref:hypothetical protein n=1 Tax=Kitasatospora sp. NPDC088783 TaxID=3364077 RepID=UPI00380FBB45